MDRRCRGWLWALGLVAVSACGEDAETPRGTCPPQCATPGPVLTGDSGAGPIIPPVVVMDAGAVAVDAGRPPVTVFDAGPPAPAVDAGIAPVDAGSLPDSGARSDASVIPADASVADGGGGGGGSMLPPVTDYAKAGPFKTTTQANVGPNNNYTIFRPEPLGENGFLHSPIIFGPGIITSADMYSSLLLHLASHGFVTICVNSMWEGPGGAGNLSDMKMGLEWLIAQNDANGVYKGKLAVNRAITMGYSIGATASVQLSSHKAIATSVVIHGHDAMGDPHGPVLMITGTSDVIDSMRRTTATLTEAPAILVALPIGHLDVLTELAMATNITPSARYIAPITAWLRYWINGDQTAKRYFWGDGCDMCKSPWIKPEPNAKWTAQML